MEPNVLNPDSEAYQEALKVDSAHFGTRTQNPAVKVEQELPWVYDPLAYSAGDRWVYQRILESIYKAFDQKLRSKYGTSAAIIDLGCGPGGSSLWFATRGHRVLGIDACKERIEAATTIAQRYLPRIKQAGGALEYVWEDFYRFQPKEPIGALVSFLTFHHFPEPKKLIERYLNYLPPNGTIMVYDQVGSSHFSAVASSIIAASLLPGTCEVPWIRRQRTALYRLLLALGKRSPDPELNPLEGIGDTKTIAAFEELFSRISITKADPLRLLHAVAEAKPKSRYTLGGWPWINEISKAFLPSKDVYIIADSEDLRRNRR